MKHVLMQRVIYPIGLEIAGRGDRRRSYNFFREHEFSSLDVNIQIQKQRLFNLLDSSVHTIPYYINWSKEHNIRLSHDRINQQLTQFPIMTKEILRKQYDDLYNLNNTKKYRFNTSGGSTGVPVRLIQDRRYIMESGRWLDSIPGHLMGDKVIKLWGSEKEILECKKDWKQRLLNKAFNREILLNTFKMTEDTMIQYIHTINRFRPDTLICYVQSAYELARFAEKHSYEIQPPKRIIVSAGTLHEEARNKIETVFQSKVYNRYGSREVSDIAIECERQNGLHINIFTQFVEILDENDNPVPTGMPGRIVITNLVNYTMPLIRYDIGDIGIMGECSCSCGRNLPKLKMVKGRTVNQFRLRNGTIVDGEYFTHLFYGIDAIIKFQVYQRDYDDILISIIKDDSLEFDWTPFISGTCSKIKLVMGDSCEIHFNFVTDIPTLPSGKYIYTYSAIK